LETRQPCDRSAIEGTLRRLRGLFEKRKVQTTDAAALRLLEKAEKEQGGSHDCIGEFKFDSNQEMLAQIRRQRAGAEAPAGR
jgi:ferredoxin--NADP+ reductase